MEAVEEIAAGRLNSQSRLRWCGELLGQSLHGPRRQVLETIAGSGAASCHHRKVEHGAVDRAYREA